MVETRLNMNIVANEFPGSLTILHQQVLHAYLILLLARERQVQFTELATLPEPIYLVLVS